MSKHTPLPWYVGYEDEVDGDYETADRFVGGFTGRKVYNAEEGICAIVKRKYFRDETDTAGEEVEEMEVIASPYVEADAEFIVRACNAHEDMLKALRNLVEAQRSGLLVCTRDDHDFVTQAKQAIAKAEGI